jgi:hypothetical protein
VAALFAGTLLVDLVIALSLLETVFLLLHHRVTGRGIAPSQFLANMVSGLSLMLALRAALTHSDWVWVAMPLVAAGVAHASDLWRRWVR